MTQRSDHETDAACEKAYRRGYAYGVQTMMSAIVDKLSKAERQSFEAWFCRRSDTVVTGHWQLSPTRTATLVIAHGQRNHIWCEPRHGRHLENMKAKLIKELLHDRDPTFLGGGNRCRVVTRQTRTR